MIPEKLNLLLKTYKIIAVSPIFDRTLKTDTMKFFFSILFIFASIITNAQARMELTPKGFDPNPIRGNLPFMTNEKFIDGTKLWIGEFSRGEADISEVTENSLTIDAFRDNAFYYSSLGDTFYQKVKYRIKLSKEGNEYVLSFQITEIYAKKNTLEIRNYGLFYTRRKNERRISRRKTIY